jgi:hypothetical protein
MTTDEQREHRRQWAEALRSGKYQQGIGRLRRDDDCFCPLGVACDLYDPQAWCLRPNNRDFTWRDRVQFPPPEISEWIGSDFELERRIFTANDVELRSFPEIADMIDAYSPQNSDAS